MRGSCMAAAEQGCESFWWTYKTFVNNGNTTIGMKRSTKEGTEGPHAFGVDLVSPKMK